MELRVPKDAGANACALAARQITAIDLNNCIWNIGQNERGRG